MPLQPANDDELGSASERNQTELRSLLHETHFLLKRAQQVIERTRPSRDRGSPEGPPPEGR